MTLFSEIYGAYFRITARLLAKEHCTVRDVRQIVQEEGFRDSALFVPPRLIPQKDGSDWGLLREEDGVLSPVTSHPPVPILTALHKRYLRAKLDDPRIALFLSSEELTSLREALASEEPLYRSGDMACTDRFSDGDPYTSDNYRKRFRTMLEAVRGHEITEVLYRGRFGNIQKWRYLPLKLEYSGRDDKFRIHGWKLKGGRLSRSSVLNMARILRVRRTGELWEGDVQMDAYFSERRCKEPVTVRVTTERNAVERFLMEFAFYEKKAERDLETGECTVRLWYDRQDEKELLIRLLGYGPVLEILGPPEFRKQAALRVETQYRMLDKNKTERSS